MDCNILNIKDILICPACSSELVYLKNKFHCIQNNHEYKITNGIPQFFHTEENEHLNNEKINKEKSFYEEYPFPNYEDFDNSSSLIEKAKKSQFALQLFDELPFNSRILEVGCGTGQLTNYLALSQRQVVGIDLSFNSLMIGNNFNKNKSNGKSIFMQMNLFKPAFKENSFHTLISNGVLHHTPNPIEGLRIISLLVKKGGYIIIGLYNKFGRIYTNLVRRILKLSENAFRYLDPHLRRKDISELRKQIWFLDQYKNPVESSHTFDEMLKAFDELNIEFISSIPSMDLSGNSSLNHNLFLKSSRGTKVSRILSQLGLLFKLNNEGGFFIMIGKKK